MRTAIISDLHFGDPECSLVGNHSIYSDLDKALGADLDYLVLLGDVLDFSISSYQQTYSKAHEFFDRLCQDRPQLNIVYIPGNHDADIWHLLEHEINVVKPVAKGENPRKFRFSVPGVLDLRSTRNASRPAFVLPHVNPSLPLDDPDKYKYGDVFLKGLVGKCNKLLVAFPNLYLVTDERCLLITHGQYFDAYWSLLGQIGPKIAPQGKVGEGLPTPLSLSDFVAVNFPLNQLACSGIGQAEPLTDVVRFVQRAVKDHDSKEIDKYLKCVDRIVLDPQFGFAPYDPREWATDIGIWYGKRKLRKALSSYGNPRDDNLFLQNEKVLKRIDDYWQMSLGEIKGLAGPDFKLPEPNTLLFGHTHVPILWENREEVSLPGGRKITAANTGGWLRKCDDNENEYVPAAVFLIEDNGAISSIPVGPQPVPAPEKSQPQPPDDDGGLIVD
ncbi:MAG: metallophosphoesterase [Candidatus Alcyoniella australis]|nr:metallophosphoesterase [Candidatus Alcyoniella australis]